MAVSRSLRALRDNPHTWKRFRAESELNLASQSREHGSCTRPTGTAATGSAFFDLTPCRVLDTRNPTGPLGGPALQPAGSPDRAFVVTGMCGIPADATAISVNVTVTNTAGGGYLSLYRGDGVGPGTYSISFAAGQTRANNAIVQLALDVSGSLKVQNTAPGNVDFILDVDGFFR